MTDFNGTAEQKVMLEAMQDTAGEYELGEAVAIILAKMEAKGYRLEFFARPQSATMQ